MAVEDLEELANLATPNPTTAPATTAAKSQSAFTPTP
jgi:hypothetical protein